MAQFNHRRNSVMEETSEDAMSLTCEYQKLLYHLHIVVCEWFIELNFLPRQSAPA
jgi:hypothetical protein